MNETPMPFFSRLALAAALLAPAATAQLLTLTPNELTFDTTVGAAAPADQIFRVETTVPGQVFSARVRAGLTNPSWLTLFPTNGQTPADVRRVDRQLRFSQRRRGHGQHRRDDPGDGADGGGAHRGACGSGGLAAGRQRLAGAVGIQRAERRFDAAAKGAEHTQHRRRSARLRLTDLLPGGSSRLAERHAAGRRGLHQHPHSPSARRTPMGLEEGEYGARIIVASNATNTPLVVPVSLVVGGPPEPSTLVVSPSSFTFFGPEGANSPPPSQILEVRKTAGSAVEYSLEVGSDGQSWLTVDPLSGTAAQAPFVHTVSASTVGLPPGTYTTQVTVSSQALAEPLTIPVTLTVGSPGIVFTRPSSLEFTGTQGMPFRRRRAISIVNSPLGPGSWTAAVTSPNSDWLRISPTQGEMPGHVIVEIDSTGIAADTVEANIRISAQRGATSSALSEGEGGAGQAVVTADIPVRLTLISDGPRLAVTPTALLMRGSAAGDPVSQMLLVDNTGGPQLNWAGAVETETGGNWLSLTPGAGTAPTEAVATANPAGLAPGAYHGRISFGAGPQQAVVPVVLVVSEEEPIVDTDFSAVYWEAAEGRTALEPVDVRTVNRGIGQATWSVEAAEFTGAQQWATVQPSAGVSSPTASSVFSVTPRVQGLAPGLYGALVEVDSAGGHAPRWLSAMLRVWPRAASVPVTMKPAGVLLEAIDGEAPSQQMRVFRNRSGRIGFLAGASTFDGGDWLSVSPAENSTDELGAANLQVTADPTGLQTGVYRGLASVAFNDGVVESAYVTLAVRPSATCVREAIFVAPHTPHVGFAGSAGRALRLEASVIDNCGTPVTGASVLALFSSGDQALPLHSVGDGRYAATWAPLSADGQANIVFRARRGQFRDEIYIVGSTDGGAGTAISRFGVVNGASFRGGEAIAPGEIISIFGRDLTNGQQFQGDTIPLPTQLGTTAVRIGPVRAPFYFAGSTQLNVQAPYELNPGHHDADHRPLGRPILGSRRSCGRPGASRRVRPAADRSGAGYRPEPELQHQRAGESRSVGRGDRSLCLRRGGRAAAGSHRRGRAVGRTVCSRFRGCLGDDRRGRGGDPVSGVDARVRRARASEPDRAGVRSGRRQHPAGVDDRGTVQQSAAGGDRGRALSARLSRMRIYPVKSLDPVELSAAVVTGGAGLKGDREWRLVGADGRVANGKRLGEAIIGIRSRYDIESSRLLLETDGRSVEGSLEDDRHEFERRAQRTTGRARAFRARLDEGLP